MRQFVVSMGVIALACGIFGQLGFSRAAPPEADEIARANDRYDRELDEARRAYEIAIKQASARLKKSYDDQLRNLMRRGGGEALDLANRLNADRKAFESEAKDDAARGQRTIGPDRAELLRILTNTDWWLSWENPDEHVGFRLLPDGTILERGKTRNNRKGGVSQWSISRRWVLNAGEMVFVPTEEPNAWRGFYAPQFREVNLNEAKH